MVKKKDGSYRVCIDFRKLNSMVLKDGFPLPIIDEVLEKLQKAKYFCVMDLQNGFFHVPIKEGVFEFNYAPFGFCNFPAVFIRYVNYIFQNLVNEGVMELYMDDIIVFGVTEDEKSDS